MYTEEDQSQRGIALEITPIRIMIVDDHPFFRQGVRFYLESIPEFEIAGEAGNGAATFDFLASGQADVVLLDLQMPEMDGVAVAQRIKTEWPNVKILILTSFNSWDKVKAALKAGANAYVLKDASPAELTAAIKAVVAGGNYLDAEITDQMLHQVDGDQQTGTLPEPLTEREMEVLGLIRRGLGNREIAATLFLSEKTVKTHVANILHKLQVKSRTQAALYAAEHKLV